MPARRINASAIQFDTLLSSLADEQELPADFTPAELDQAHAAAKTPLPTYPDKTSIELVTIDPPGSRDLDQALALLRTPTGYRVYYAIADVAHFVPAGSDLDRAANARGETLYLPDRKIPLHPEVLSEDAASLLPDRVRPAALWTIDVDKSGAVTTAHVARALVRSRAQYDYAHVQNAIVSRKTPAVLEPLAELGALRIARARARGAIDLRRPEQQVEREGTGWRLNFRAQSPVEEFNAHMSLLTGEGAAHLMLAGGIGLLRTLPSVPAHVLARVRRGARALGIVWPSGASIAQVLATVDSNDPKGGAFIDLAASLLRGSGYTTFDGALPAQSMHAGVGAPYAHVTAPLRRLADRYATEICLALSAGQAVPEWVRVALPGLPDAMTASNRRAKNVERAVLDYAEAMMLTERIGETFIADVVDVDPRTKDMNPETVANEKLATIVVDEPAVRARCYGENLEPGMRIRARLTEADPRQRRVRFAAV